MAIPISASFGPGAVSEVIALTGGNPQRMAQLGVSHPEFKPAIAVLHLVKQQGGAPPMPTKSIADQAMNPPPPQNPGATGLGAINVPKGPPMGQMPGQPPGQPPMQMAAAAPPMPQMAGGGLLALDNSAFDEQSFSGGGIVAFAGGGDSKAERRKALMRIIRTAETSDQRMAARMELNAMDGMDPGRTPGRGLADALAYTQDDLPQRQPVSSDASIYSPDSGEPRGTRLDPAEFNRNPPPSNLFGNAEAAQRGPNLSGLGDALAAANLRETDAARGTDASGGMSLRSPELAAIDARSRAKNEAAGQVPFRGFGRFVADIGNADAAGDILHAAGSGMMGQKIANSMPSSLADLDRLTGARSGTGSRVDPKLFDRARTSPGAFRNLDAAKTNKENRSRFARDAESVLTPVAGVAGYYGDVLENLRDSVIKRVGPVALANAGIDAKNYFSSQDNQTPFFKQFKSRFKDKPDAPGAAPYKAPPSPLIMKSSGKAGKDPKLSGGLETIIPGAKAPAARVGGGEARTGGGSTRRNTGTGQDNAAAAAAPERSIEQYFADNQKLMGPDLVPPGTSAEDRDARRQEDLWTTLAQMGFGMAAGNSQFALENIGKGAAAAMPAMQEAIKNRRADDREERKETFAAQLAARGVKGDMLKSAVTQFSDASRDKQAFALAKMQDLTSRRGQDITERVGMASANKLSGMETSSANFYNKLVQDHIAKTGSPPNAQLDAQFKAEASEKALTLATGVGAAARNRSTDIVALSRLTEAAIKNEQGYRQAKRKDPNLSKDDWVTQTVSRQARELGINQDGNEEDPLGLLGR